MRSRAFSKVVCMKTIYYCNETMLFIGVATRPFISLALRKRGRPVFIGEYSKRKKGCVARNSLANVICDWKY